MAEQLERWSASVVLTDGETVHVRPITPADASALAEFHDRQSSDSVYRRYFSAKPHLTEAELKRFTTVDFVDRVALVVESHGEFMAWASYERWPGRDDAEAAFMVDDRHQGRGIATLLLEHLAAIARSNGIGHFTAEVLGDNRPMLAVFTRAGWPVQRRFESGIVDVDFDLTDTVEFVDSVQRREQRGDSRAMARLLLPRSVALVGASDVPGSIGHALWRNLSHGFDGPLYPVNPAHPTVDGRQCFPSLTAIDLAGIDLAGIDGVSLAIVAVPAAALAAVIDDCIAARVRGALIITAVDGVEIDMNELVDRARRNGLRLIGPASMGIAAPGPPRLQAALVDLDLPRGGVAISMQSGSLGGSVLRLAAELEIGISWFVSLGDKCDVSANDLMQFWEDDETTSVIALYTESWGNPRKFARIARRVSRRRPIVAVRTGAAAIGPAGGALYHQAGLIEVPTVNAMLDTVRVLSSQPVLAGRNVAVLTNAGSPGVLARTALATAGLAAVDPPVPLTWRSTNDDYAVALTAAIADDGIDGVLVVHAPPVTDAVAAPVAQIDAAAAGSAKPVVAILLGRGDGPLRPGSMVPAFSFPERAAAVLGRSFAYGHWLRTEGAEPVEAVTGVDPDAAAAIIADALAGEDEQLSLTSTRALLATYGVAMAVAREAGDDAIAVADEIGYPVAVKAAHRHVGRSVRAGIALDLVDADDVAGAVASMRDALGRDADTVIVQQMVSPGVDVRIRSQVEPRLGPVLGVGLGGVQGDLLDDGANRLAPVTTEGARSLLTSSRVQAALDEAQLANEAILDVVVRVAQLTSDHQEIVELELNPVIVSADGCWVTDARVLVGARAPIDGPLRRLE